MRRIVLVTSLILSAAPAVSNAAPATQIQGAEQRLLAAQHVAPIPPATLDSLRNALALMKQDQAQAVLFQVDARIFAARMEGLAEIRGQEAQQRQLDGLQEQVQRLGTQYQALQAEYGHLRQQLAAKTMSTAQTQHLEQEIQQQKTQLQQEEKRVAALAGQSQQSAAPAYAKALTVYAQVRAASDGVHVSMPAASLFADNARLSSAGRQRLQAMASILKQASASQVLVRVAPQPGGISLATQRAEAILHALRQDGIPDRVLALATGSGLTPGTAELLLVGQAAP
ncbi:MAG: hypothetical protein ACP5MM_02895 [Acidithiobacillus sp.]|uniref:hypothetical protein n=1 Tax=Acidithiobacillus sp. TaxID=1872118 RepID=UPI003CFD273D